VLHPDLIKPLIDKDPRVGRLFPNPREEEISYYKKTGIFPIMHVMGIKQAIVDEHPWIPINLYHAFNEAKKLTMRRLENPRIVPLVFYRDFWEEQEEIFGTDPWEYGLTDENRHNFATLVRYAFEQGLISRDIPVDELFLPIGQGRKRGEEFRI
jgi:4,5-dihydroxyphthalate decarboxylase